jgi:signal transduction histidine kinase
MESTVPAGIRPLRRLWDGFVTTFLAWSPPPEPVVTWKPAPGRFTRLGRWVWAFSWLVVIGVFALGVAASAEPEGPGGLASLGVGAIAAAPLVLARYNLIVGWRAALAGTVLAAILGQFLPLGAAAGLAVVGLLVYTLVIATTHQRSIALWAWAVTIPVVTAGVGEDIRDTIGVVAIAGAVLALVTDGLRASQQGTQQLIDERERVGLERARRVSVEERARIARELHDVVAHHMSMVAVRAETAPYRVHGLSDETRSEFAEISTAARASLNEIRSVLTLLRGDETPRMPQPDLDQVDELVEDARRAGANVELHVTGRRRPLRAAVELSAYRILQESLANVTRHMPGETAGVWVDYRNDTLGLVVANPCPEPAGDPGHGITGMQERATAVGGTLDARRRADGRFVVEATLPLKP